MTNQHIQSNWDVIVIGSGVGGLTAAALLAVHNKRVLVLEQHSVLGGCSHVFRRKKKWEFDVGIHYVGNGGADGTMARIFRSLGLENNIEFLPMDPDGFDTISFPHHQMRVPVGWNRYLDNLIATFPKDEKGLRKFVGIISALGFAIDRCTTPSSLGGNLKMVYQSGLTPSFWALQPVARLLDHCQLSPEARATASVQFGLYGCPPSRAPVALHAGLLHNYIHQGAWYPKGGGQVIAGNLLNVIKAYDGLARTSSLVSKILVKNNQVTGVQLDSGEIFTAPIIISNADLKKTYTEMIGIDNLPSGTLRKVKKYRMSAPFLNIYLGIEDDLRKKIPNTNFFSMPSTANLEQTHVEVVENAVDIGRKKWIEKVRRDMPGFVHCATVKDPTNTRHAPEGCSTLEVMYLMPKERHFWTDAKEHENYSKDPAYLDLKAEVTEIMIDRAESVIPGIKEKIIWKEASTPLTQGRYIRSTDYSIYGLEVNTRQFALLRPKSRTAIGGLFIAGTNTTWGPSIEGAIISGMQAASAVLDRDIDQETRAGAIYAQPSKIPVLPANWDPLKLTSNLNHRAKIYDIHEGDMYE